MTEKATRIETDTMGEMAVPADAYWGASTQRAVLNFPISDLRYPADFVHILGRIKRAAARANAGLGLLDQAVADAVADAATEVVDGKWDAHFVVDLFQTGSGTSTNTNANEVIAKRARELAPDVRVHPNDHVNMAQSSNDVIPTATHLTVAHAIQTQLLPALAQAHATLAAKAEEFWPVIKTGRTHLQDATPIRLGQEFQGYASQLELAGQRLSPHVDALTEVALGGTAVGTGINAHKEFAARTCALLAEELGMPVRETAHHFQAQNTLDALVAASGAVRGAAVSMQKIANDLRWLASGPRAGLAELELPTVQPGSSIMPRQGQPGHRRVGRAGRMPRHRKRRRRSSRGPGRVPRAQHLLARRRLQLAPVGRAARLGDEELRGAVPERNQGHLPRAGHGGTGFDDGDRAHPRHRVRQSNADREGGRRTRRHGPGACQGAGRAQR